MTNEPLSSKPIADDEHVAFFRQVVELQKSAKISAPHMHGMLAAYDRLADKLADNRDNGQSAEQPASNPIVSRLYQAVGEREMRLAGDAAAKEIERLTGNVEAYITALQIVSDERDRLAALLKDIATDEFTADFVEDEDAWENDYWRVVNIARKAGAASETTDDQWTCLCGYKNRATLTVEVLHCDKCERRRAENGSDVPNS